MTIKNREVLDNVTDYYKEVLYKELGSESFIELTGVSGIKFIIPWDIVDLSKIKNFKSKG